MQSPLCTLRACCRGAAPCAEMQIRYHRAASHRRPDGYDPDGVWNQREHGVMWPRIIMSFVAGLALGGSLVVPAAALGASGTPAVAEAAPDRLAARQGMLVERIAAAACFAAEGIAPGHAMAAMQSAHDAFDAAMESLIAPDPEAAPAALTGKAGRDAVDAVKAQWVRYRTPVREALEAGTVEDETLARIVALNPALRAATDAAAARLARAGGSQVLSALGLAERQRTLSQSIARDACLLATEAAPEETRATLAESVESFDLALQALAQGMPEAGIAPPEGRELRLELTATAEAWTRLKPVLMPLLAGETPRPDALAATAEATETMRSHLERAVALYAAD